MSADLVKFPPFKTSGAVHRMAWLGRYEVSGSGPMSVVTATREKPVICARPVVSTRTLDWQVSVRGKAGFRATYSLEGSMHHATRVEVAETLSDVRQLAVR